MNPLASLYETYQQAEKAGLVDQHGEDTDPILLPIFHDSKKSKGNDVIEIKINEKGEFLDARFLPDEVYIEFPVSEKSIGRSSGIAPHPLVDKMLYLSERLSLEMKTDKKEQTHHQAYLDQLQTWAYYEKTHSQPLLRSICSYLLNPENDVFTDSLPALFGDDFQLMGQGKVEQKEGNRTKTHSFPDLFVTFCVEYSDSQLGTRFVTRDQSLHQHYIQFLMEGLEKKPLKPCDISGEETYLTFKHQGLMGNAKVVSNSTHKEIYFGRFQNGEELVHIGLITSQKVFLMLKYFLESKTNGRYLSSGAYLIGWFTHDIYNTQDFQPDNLSPLEDLLTDFSKEGAEKESDYTFGGQVAKLLLKKIVGNSDRKPDEISYQLMMVEKTSKGRVALKYFRKYTGSQLAENVGYWYASLAWPFYNTKTKSKQPYVPPLYRIVNTLYGEEQETGPYFSIIGDRNKVIAGKMIEDLIPSVMERKPLPAALAAKAWHNAKNRAHYKKYWPNQLQTDCIVLQKYFKDLTESYPKHVKEEQNLAYLDEQCNDRSYLYGRLLAVYDRIEKDSQYFRKMGQANGEGKEKSNPAYDRETNAARLWTAFIARPHWVNLTLSSKIQPYFRQLKAERPERARFYEILLGELMPRIFEANQGQERQALNEMFLFGYYGQSQAFFKTKKAQAEEENQENGDENVEEIREGE